MAAAIIKSSIDNVCRLSRLVGQIWGSSPIKSDVISRLPSSSCGSTTTPTSAANFVPTRGKHFDHHFVNRWMARDYKRRVLLKEHYPERQRMVAMKRCSLLPREFQEVVSKELHAMPRDSCHVRTKPRCILSSRPRWVLHKYRVSRIHYRLLADYNKLSGVMRATW